MTKHTQNNQTADTIADNDTTNSEPISEQNAEQKQTETCELSAKIAELEAQVANAKEAAARANADSYNAQRRMEQETDKAKKYALQKFAKEMLDVVDNLERAIENLANADEAVIEGVKLTHKSLIAVLEKNGVIAVGEVGEAFNPDLHEAVGIHPEADKDIVGQVLQKGYTLNERTLRPAIVMVGG
ncbi:nucleotide exchange factor GrpE [Moraxella nasovis]|uniref:nucleotide exchange factor GrpE n=1 Tax=Moraxella nasovis TaxID=2904121 RepID=UPI001F6112EA|nr:nucleotide exchange factor GrpE [Moraxella nasovis]UNU74218.1 nucleotide exchange factor GrpE [Moraxella nasovis]